MTAPSTPSRRYDGLDVVRAGAMLLGVFYHATSAYMPDVGRWYVVADQASYPAFATLATLLHAGRMQVFFALSGFFAHLVMDRRGENQFLVDRFKRLMVPFFAFLFPVMALDWAARAWAKSLGAMDPAYAPGDAWLWRPVHLWFLELLFGLCVVAWLLARLQVPGGAVARVAGVLLRVPELYLVPAGFTAAGLLWLGEAKPSMSLMPDAASVWHYTPFFVFGWLLWANREHADRLRRCLWMAPVGLVLGVALFSTPLQWQPPGRWLSALVSWMLTLGVMGWALRLRTGQRPWLNAAVDASYWVYLVHYPLVVFGHVLFTRTHLPALLEYALVIGGATSLSFLTFRLFIKNSPLAPWLGVRIRDAEVRPPARPPPPRAAAAAVADRHPQASIGARGLAAEASARASCRAHEDHPRPRHPRAAPHRLWSRQPQVHLGQLPGRGARRGHRRRRLRRLVRRALPRVQRLHRLLRHLQRGSGVRRQHARVRPGGEHGPGRVPHLHRDEGVQRRHAVLPGGRRHAPLRGVRLQRRLPLRALRLGTHLCVGLSFDAGSDAGSDVDAGAEVDAGADAGTTTPDAGACIVHTPPAACTMECDRGFSCVNGACVLNGAGGAVQVTLRWNTDEDVDLHVLEPLANGGSCEIYYGDVNGSSCGAVGTLDLDSNAGCNIDSVDIENVIYPAGVAVPRGTYQVRVDHYENCNQATTVVPYEVEVRNNGVVSGFCGSFVVNGPGWNAGGGAGGGTTVMSFTVP